MSGCRAVRFTNVCTPIVLQKFYTVGISSSISCTTCCSSDNIIICLKHTMLMTIEIRLSCSCQTLKLYGM